MVSKKENIQAQCATMIRMKLLYDLPGSNLHRYCSNLELLKDFCFYNNSKSD